MTSTMAGICSGRLSAMPLTSVTTICAAASSSCGSAAPMAVTRLFTMDSAASASCGMALTAVLMSPGSMPTKLSISPCAPSISVGSRVSRIAGICGKSACASWLRPSVRRGSSIWMRGMRFSPTVTMLSTRFPSSASKSWLSSAMPVRKFCHAERIDEMLP